MSNFNSFNTSLSTVGGQVWKHKVFLIGNKCCPTRTQHLHTEQMAFVRLRDRTSEHFLNETVRMDFPSFAVREIHIIVHSLADAPGVTPAIASSGFRFRDKPSPSEPGAPHLSIYFLTCRSVALCARWRINSWSRQEHPTTQSGLLMAERCGDEL